MQAIARTARTIGVILAVALLAVLLGVLGERLPLGRDGRAAALLLLPVLPFLGAGYAARWVYSGAHRGSLILACVAANALVYVFLVNPTWVCRHASPGLVFDSFRLTVLYHVLLTLAAYAVSWVPHQAGRGAERPSAD